MADRAPFCDCVGSRRGYTNAKYDETGDVRDQWLHAECGRPARKIFDSTDRWELERDLWYMVHPK